MRAMTIAVFAVICGGVWGQGVGGADLVPQFEAVSAGAPSQRAAAPLILRGAQTFLFQPLADGTVVLQLTYMPVNNSKPLTATLRDSAGNVIAQEDVSGTTKIRAKAAVPGTCELRVETDTGSMKIDSPCAWAVHGLLHGFRSLPTVFFYVPDDLAAFQVHVRGGGGEEHIVWTLDAGVGAPVKRVDTSLEGVSPSVDIQVPEGGGGRIWTLVFGKPAEGFNEDFYVSLSGGVESAFAVTADRVLRDKLIPPETMEVLYGERIAAMREILDASAAASDAARYWRGRIAVQVDGLSAVLRERRRYSEQDEVERLVAAVSRLARAYGDGRLTSTTILAAGVPAVTNERILITDTMLPGDLGGAVRVSVARDEFESGSFAVLPEQSFGRVALSVSALRTDDGAVLPSSCVDVRIVKVWYQDEGRGYRKETPTNSYNPIGYAGKRVLVPELLLHDDGLIRVDLGAKRNEMRVGRTADGTPEYVSISDPEGVAGRTREEFPVTDADELQPFELPARQPKQFWVTVRGPADAVAGSYRGEIRLAVGGDTILVQPLVVDVLPFALPRSATVCSIYYYSPSATYYGDAVMDQYRREMENLRDHGVLDVMHPYSAENEEALRIRREVGMSESSILFYRGWYAHSVKDDVPDRLRIVRETTKAHLDQLHAYGFKEIYFYGIDEARGDRLAKQRDTWITMRDLGAKIFVAGYRDSNFPLMGDIQDLLVCAGYPSRDESGKWHSKGHRIVSYGNPQGGVEAPETYRRNFGFLLWQYGYDGCMTYIYHWGAAQNWGNRKSGSREFASVWNDFCRKDRYKQHNMVYPTADGVVDTLQWEGYREAIDDLRYMTLLEQRLAKAPEDSPAAAQARDWLAELRQGDINAVGTDCDDIRARIVQFILALN